MVSNIKAEILMGNVILRDKKHTPVSSDCFTLYMDEDRICSLDYRVGMMHPSSMTCRKAAVDMAEKMTSEDICEYDIINGQTYHPSRDERVPCEPIPEDAVKVFRETLEKKLKR